MADRFNSGLHFAPFSFLAGGVVTGFYDVYKHLSKAPDLGTFPGTPIALPDEKPLGHTETVEVPGDIQAIVGTNSYLPGKDIAILGALCLLGSLLYYFGHRSRRGASSDRKTITLLEAQVEDLKVQNQDLRGHLQESQDSLQDATTELANLENTVTKAEAQLDEQSKTIIDLSAEKRRALGRLEKAEISNLSLSADLHNERSDHKTLRLELAIVRSETESERIKSAGNAQKLENNTRVIADLRSRLQSYEPKLASMNARHEESENALRSQIDDLEAAKSDLEAAMNHLRPELFKNLSNENTQMKKLLESAELEKALRVKASRDMVDAAINAQNTEHETLINENANLRTQITDLEESHKSNGSKFQTEKHHTDTELASLRQAIEIANNTESELRKQIEERDRRLADYDQVLKASEDSRLELKSFRQQAQNLRDLNQDMQETFDDQKGADSEPQKHTSKVKEFGSKDWEMRVEVDHIDLVNDTLPERPKEAPEAGAAAENDGLTYGTLQHPNLAPDERLAENQEPRNKLSQYEEAQSSLDLLRVQYGQLEEASRGHKTDFENANAENQKLSNELQLKDGIENDLKTLHAKYDELAKSTSDLHLDQALAKENQELLKNKVLSRDNEIKQLKEEARRQISARDTQLEELREEGLPEISKKDGDIHRLEGLLLQETGIGTNAEAMDISSDPIASNEGPAATGPRSTPDSHDSAYLHPGGQGYFTFDAAGNPMPAAAEQSDKSVADNLTNRLPQPPSGTFDFAQIAQHSPNAGGFKFESVKPTPIADVLDFGFSNFLHNGGNAPEDDSSAADNQPPINPFAQNTDSANVMNNASTTQPAFNGQLGHAKDSAKPIIFQSTGNAGPSKIPQRKKVPTKGPTKGKGPVTDHRPAFDRLVEVPKNETRSNIPINSSRLPNATSQEHNLAPPSTPKSGPVKRSAGASRTKRIDKPVVQPTAIPGRQIKQAKGKLASKSKPLEGPDGSFDFDNYIDHHLLDQGPPSPVTPPETKSRAWTYEDDIKLFGLDTESDDDKADPPTPGATTRIWSSEEDVDIHNLDSDSEHVDSNPPTPWNLSPVSEGGKGDGIDWDEMNRRVKDGVSPTSSELLDHVTEGTHNEGNEEKVESPASPGGSDGGGDAGANPEEYFT